MIWYGGGKLAPDLTLPKLRTRWASPAGHHPVDGTGLPAAAARAVLRSMVARAAEHSPDEASFFARLREGGALGSSSSGMSGAGGAMADPRVRASGYHTGYRRRRGAR